MGGTELVHRIAGFPAGASKPATKAILDDIFGSDTEITVRSVGVHPLAVTAVVATVIFSPVPVQLKRNSKSRISEVVRYNGQPLQIHLEIDTDFLGFTPLNVVDGSQSGQIDCILVSGLSSHAYGSWKERGGRFMWPIDTEDSRPPNVRFLLWGYDTSLINSESFQDIEDIGGSLATALEGIHLSFARDEDGDRNPEFEARPIVFIAHSLGGLVVKEAICQMAQDLAYLRCVYGLILFGVPHNGLLVDPWRQIVGQRANADLVRSLEPGSRDLQRLDKAFRNIFRLPGSRVVSVYETMKSSTTKEESPGVFRRSGDSQVLVNRVSACGTWPESVIHREIAMNRTHEDLPKFEGPFDDAFLRLRPILDNIWAEAFDAVQNRFEVTERRRLVGRAQVINGTEVHHRNGLIQIWPVVESHRTGPADTEVDVIAIHGLGGHPHSTWTIGGRNWLREFLPFEIPGIRVLTFGYNSVLAFGGSRSSFGEIARNLLDDLSRMRQSHQDQSDQKIVFICHSFGGLILKQALLLANELGIQFSTIKDNIAGVLFLGTPNKDNQVAYWKNLYSNIVELENLPELDVTSSETMLSISADLGKTCSQFNDQIAPKLQIFSLYEQLESSDTKCLVVNQASAILRLPTETILPLETDHKGLSRFLTKSSAVYRIICECLSDLMETENSSFRITNTDNDVKIFVRLLNAVDETKVFDPLDHVLPDSTKWIIDHADFKAWNGKGVKRVLWLHGPPGSGKTVLMKSIVHFLTRRRQASQTRNIYKPVSFFFDVKDPNRNSSMAFIKSVLAQILQDQATCFVFKHLDRSDHKEIMIWENEDKLWMLLFTIVRKSRGIIFQVAIDALDEGLRAASSSSTTILHRLEELIATDISRRVRLLISHREKRLASDLLAQDAVKVDTQNSSTESSVSNIIRMKVCRILEDSGIPTRAGQAIEEKIVEVSRGNYLHATLVWQQFAQGVQTWTIEEISLGLRRLDTLSCDLISSYCRLLRGINPSYRTRARTAFAILGVCREELDIKQLAFLSSLYERIRSTNDAKKLPSDTVSDLMRDCADLEAYLSESCGYLIKRADNGTFGFAHSSAKDLFTENQCGLSSQSATTLSEYALSSKDAHDIMRRLCSAILHLEIDNQQIWIRIVEAAVTTMEEEKQARIQDWIRKKRERKENGEKLKQASVIERIQNEKKSEEPSTLQRILIEGTSHTPCFTYSIFHWFEHYEAAPPSQDSDQQQVDTLVSLAGQVSHMLWVLMTRNTVPHYDWSRTQSLQPQREVYLFRIISRGDHPALVKALIDQGANPNFVTSFYMEDDRPEEHGISPLSWAIVCQRRKTFDLFLRNETIQVNRGLRMTPKPLHFAISTAQPYYVEKVVQHPDCNVNVTDHKGTPLHLALYRMNYKAVEIILDQEHVGVWAKDHHGESAYERAFSHGIWGSIFEKLLQAAKTDAREVLAEPIKGISQLSMAGTHGWKNVEEIILREDLQQLFLVDSHTGMSPLIFTAYFGRKEKLLWMLDRVPPTGVPLRRKSDKFDLLHLCADQDWENVVRLLQRKYGMKSVASDHRGRTLLHWAVEYGWDIDPFSLSQDKEILDRPDRDGFTVIHLAVLTRDMKVLRLLVDAGADCFLRDKNGMTPAHLAADSGFREALELFIDMPTREFGRTRTGASLLHLIASWFDGTTVSKFVNRKRALLDVVDKNRCTPLHFAAMVNNLSSVDTLVAMGCNINARNSSRRTPLHEAIRGGSVGTTLLLLKLGADYDAVDAFGQTCLLMVYRYGLESLVPRFLSLGCSIHDEDVFGMTPLHRACASGNSFLIRGLLNSGANWKPMNKHHRTPLDLAVECRNYRVVKYMALYLRQKWPHSKTRQHIFDRALTLAIQEECGDSIERVLEKYEAKADRDSIVVHRIYNSGPSPQPGVLPVSCDIGPAYGILGTGQLLWKIVKFAAGTQRGPGPVA